MSLPGELKKLFETFDDLDKNLEGVKDNTLSWRQTLEDSANLWNCVSPGDDRLVVVMVTRVVVTRVVVMVTRVVVTRVVVMVTRVVVLRLFVMLCLGNRLSW